MTRRLCLAAMLFVAAVARADTLRIGTITVRTTPLFDPATESGGGFYRVADRLQVATRVTLIRRFLLFREGDELDAAKLRESERNLRQLDFLRSVSITSSVPHDGIVDVIVTTEDAWTTDVNADFSNDGGRSLYDFDVTQKNLFNRGSSVDLRSSNGLYRHTNSIEVIDPEMFGPYWTADALGALSSDGNQERVSIERPAFSYATRYTGIGSFDHLLQDSRIYRTGFIDNVFRQTHREAIVQGGQVVRSRPAATARLLAGVDLIDDWFRPIQGAAPTDRHFRFGEIGFDRTRLNFITLDHVDYGLRKQDFNIGAHGALFGAIAPPEAGHGVVYRIRSDSSYGRALGEGMFLLTHASASTRIHAANRNAIVSSDTRFIFKLSSAKYPETFIARAHLDVGWSLDRDLQFLLDGQNSLRAYPNFSFEGSRRFVFNLEHRVFLGRELLQIFEPGVAAFLDTGEAFDGAFRPRDLKTDFGAGLRLCIARLDTAMLRFDVSYAVNDSPTSRKGIKFSVATVQAF